MCVLYCPCACVSDVIIFGVGIIYIILCGMCVYNLLN